MLKFTHTVVVTLTSLLLTACFSEDQSVTLMEDYQKRLATILGTDVPEMPDVKMVSLPRKRELTTEVAAVNLGLLDAYELRKCGLFHLIAERNSILGKVADPFHRLDYEVAFIQTARGCMNNSLSPAVKKQLEDAIALKESQFQTLLWNSIAQSDVWLKQLSLSVHTLPIEKSDYVETIQAITQFSNLAISFPTRPVDVISWQQPIEAKAVLGPLFTSLEKQTALLRQTSNFLDANLHSVLCGQNLNMTQLERLKTVFYKYYVAQIQPYLAQVDSLYRDVEPALANLEKLPAPAAFDSYKHAYLGGKAYEEFQHETKRHALVWTQLFERCNVKVGSQLSDSAT